MATLGKRCAGLIVTTEDGTGVVHIAPSFGADDFRVAKQNGIGSLTLVDKQGKFIEGCGELTGRFVKNEYDPTLTADVAAVGCWMLNVGRPASRGHFPFATQSHRAESARHFTQSNEPTTPSRHHRNGSPHPCGKRHPDLLEQH